MLNSKSGRTELEYNGAPLNAEPVDGTLAEVARNLVIGRSVSVTLEPGDATRYELLLVPMWEREVNIGNYSPKDTEGGLVVVRFVSGNARDCAVTLLNRAYRGDDIEQLSNLSPWTATFLNWWFDQLWYEILCVRYPPNKSDVLINVDENARSGFTYTPLEGD